MSKHSMTALRERRAERGLVQMNLWIREADRAGEMDPAHRPGRKRLAAVRASVLHLQQSRTHTPPETPPRPAERHPPSRPAITLPCRLIFPARPPAHIRNAMKDDGWVYDKLAGVWTAGAAELVERWLPELSGDWQARIIGTIN